MAPIEPASAQALTDADIIRATSEREFRDGCRYAGSGRVRQVVVTDGGRVVEATTRGTAPKPYRQHIALRADRGGRLEIRGICSCPVGGNCKHVAAVLVAARRSRSLTPTDPPGPAEAPLPSELHAWLSDLEAAGRTGGDANAYPENVRSRIFYVLDLQPAPGGSGEGPGTPQLAIQAVSAVLRKDGSIGSGTPLGLGSSYKLAGKQHLLANDQIILHRLAARGGPNRSPEDDPLDTLRRIIATGRARWEALTGPTVSEAPERPGRLGWRLNADGSQSPAVDLDGPGTAFRLPDPWHVDPETGAMGPVTLGLPARLARQIMAAPPVPADAALRVRTELARRVPALDVPAPAALPKPELVSDAPRPVLRLLLGSAPGPILWGRFTVREDERSPMARLAFRYGPVLIERGRRPEVIAQDGQLYRVRQDDAAEAQAARDLEALGLVPLFRHAAIAFEHPHGNNLVLADTGAGAWIAFLATHVPALRAKGWTVEIDPDFPIRLLEPDGDITAQLTEGSGIDWFELHLGVTLAGEQVDLVPALVRLIASEAGARLLQGLDAADGALPFVFPLLDGRIVSIPLARIRPMLHALGELFARGGIDQKTGQAGFSRHDAADLAAIEAAAPALAWRGAEAVRALGRQLREAGGAIPRASLPPSFHGTLRPYQQRGVDWLQFLRAAELGGVLADDMGLGKTVQTLAHLLIEKAEGRLDKPALIVCPTSLVPTWWQEAERFAPSLKRLALHGPSRRARFGEIAAHDLVITTYPLLTRDRDVLTAQEWRVVVLDEAQTIKNPMAEKARLACGLKAHRLCLSGTPLENHLGELWSLFDFLAPGFLGSRASFRAGYQLPVEKRGDTARLSALVRRVRPFLLRRTKGEVAADLPPKTEIVEPVALEDAQRAIYDTVRLAMHKKVREAIAERGLSRSGIVILDALLKMRQVCCDPRLLKLAAAKKAKAGSAKLDRLMELLALLLDEGRRVLVFSQFTSMLALIEERLSAARIDYVRLTGDTVDRQTPVRRFQAGKVPLFLLSLKAGGTGLTLTAADTVIHYDPWWNPAVEAQATDRAHRIGQDKPVFVHRLVSQGTIEEKMETLKARKRALAASVLDAERGGTLALTEADIETLFAA